MWTKRSLLNKINHSYFPIKDIWKVNHFYFPIKDIWKVDWFQKWDVTLSIMLQYIKLLSCWGLILCVFLSLASFGEASCHELYSCKNLNPINNQWAWKTTQSHRWDHNPSQYFDCCFVRPWEKNLAMSELLTHGNGLSLNLFQFPLFKVCF